MYRLCAFIFLIVAFAASAWAGVAVSSPSSGAKVGSPVSFVASAGSTTCSRGVASMGVYIDNQLTYVVNGTSLNTKLSLNPGSHKTVVQQWDYCGGSSYAVMPLTVTTASGVFVTSPSNNGAVGSPVRFTATAATSTCPKGVASMGIYTAPSPDKKVYVTQGDSLNTSVALSPGTYNTVVQEWDYCGGAAFTPVTRWQCEREHAHEYASSRRLAGLGRTRARLRHLHRLPARSYLVHDTDGWRHHVQYRWYQALFGCPVELSHGRPGVGAEFAGQE